MQINDAGITGSAVDDVVDGRLAYVAHLGELIDRDAALFAQAADAVCVDFAVGHKNSSHTIIVT